MCPPSPRSGLAPIHRPSEFGPHGVAVGKRAELAAWEQVRLEAERRGRRIERVATNWVLRAGGRVVGELDLIVLEWPSTSRCARLRVIEVRSEWGAHGAGGGERDCTAFLGIGKRRRLARAVRIFLAQVRSGGSSLAWQVAQQIAGAGELSVELFVYREVERRLPHQGWRRYELDLSQY